MTTTNLSIGPFEVHVPDEDWLTSDGASRPRAGLGVCGGCPAVRAHWACGTPGAPPRCRRS
jgi:hypothetical protein